MTATLRSTQDLKVPLRGRPAGRRAKARPAGGRTRPDPSKARPAGGKARPAREKKARPAREKTAKPLSPGRGLTTGSARVEAKRNPRPSRRLPGRLATLIRGVPGVVVVGAAVFSLVVTSLGFSAVQVSSQATLDDVRGQIEVAENARQELKAAVSAAHSPDAILKNAEQLGLIEPAGVVVLPAPPMVSEADRG